MQYCQCGCNQPTNKITRSNPKRGYVKGEYHRYLPGHNPTGYRTIEKYFWSYCTPGMTGECWEWQSSTLISNGYGAFSFRKKKRYAHRVSYELHHGPIPNGMFVCHSCDNRKCCNPAHLFLGTNSDNVDDMMQKDRNAYGEKSGHAVLREGDVIEIRRLAAGGIRYKDLADRFNVSEGSISDAVGGRTWKHVTQLSAFRKNYKPTSNDVLQMHSMIASGMSYRAVSRAFGTSHHVVRRATQNSP